MKIFGHKNYFIFKMLISIVHYHYERWFKIVTCGTIKNYHMAYLLYFE